MSKRAPTEEEALRELAGIYEKADALFAASSCSGTADCCHADLVGRVPIVTSIEAIAASRARTHAPREARVPARTLPIARRAPEKRPCPLLDSSGRCTIYASRPLGCRTYFCDRAVHGERVNRRALRDLVTSLRDLAERVEGAAWFARTGLTAGPRELSRALETRTRR